VPDTQVRYQSGEEDSGRWIGFPFRPGDIVISTRSKSGTTWMQMICALLVFQVPRLPAPLARLSPWLDWLVRPRDEVIAQLEAQQHRRFIKTHTPLDGIPLDPRASYIVVARHPLDMAVSMYHQSANIDRGRLAALTGRPELAQPRAQRPLHEWLARWAGKDADPRDDMDSLCGVLWHLSDAWARHGSQNVILVHYADLAGDLPAEMRRIAALLGIEVPAQAWPDLVSAAGFQQMSERSVELLPTPDGLLKDPAAFFRRGSSGAGREVLTSAEYDAYLAHAARFAPPGLLTWLHR
jgi:aryl sulfotransferase